VAYLQTIPAVHNPLPARSPAFDVPAPANYLDPATIPTPATSNPQYASAIRGRYLATEAGICVECHTPHLATGLNAIDTSPTDTPRCALMWPPRRAGEAADIHVQAKLRPSGVRDQLGHHPM
jgi:hypothetical protein